MQDGTMASPSWPDLQGMTDTAEGLEIEIRRQDGGLDRQVLPKDFRLDVGEFSGAVRNNVLRRPFDFHTGRRLMVAPNGGIGDRLVILECVLGLRAQIAQRSEAEFEVVGLFGPKLAADMERFLACFPIFDRQMSPATVDKEGLWSGAELLNTTHQTGRVDHFSLGSMWDLNWARWGIPGRFVPSDQSGLRAAAMPRLLAEHHRLSASGPLPPWQSYVVCCPEAFSGRERKAWPVENWQHLVAGLRDAGGPTVVMLAADPDLLKLAALVPGGVAFDFSDPRRASDVLSLASLLAGALGVVSIDSGPALMAGFLGVPCVTLWGPSNPIYYGHRNNLNVRVSACPPCMWRYRATLCRKNICMSEIEAEEIAELVGRMLTGDYEPR